MNTSLITPSVDMSSFSSAAIRFNEDYLSLGDNADVDISTDGGTSWTNVLAQTTRPARPGLTSIDITALAAGEADVKVRFHNYNAFWAWWWQVDNVLVGPRRAARPARAVWWSAPCATARTGAGLNGATVANLGGDSTTTFATPDPAQGDGFYILYAEAGPQTFEASFPAYEPQTKSATVIPSGAVRLDFALAAGLLDASPRPLSLFMSPGGAQDLTLLMTNTGTGDGGFEILEVNVTPSSVRRSPRPSPTPRTARRP